MISSVLFIRGIKLLGKADTALQQHQSLAAYRKAADQDAVDLAQNTEINKKANATARFCSFAAPERKVNF